MKRVDLELYIESLLRLGMPPKQVYDHAREEWKRTHGTPSTRAIRRIKGVIRRVCEEMVPRVPISDVRIYLP